MTDPAASAPAPSASAPRAAAPLFEPATSRRGDTIADFSTAPESLRPAAWAFAGFAAALLVMAGLNFVIDPYDEFGHTLVDHPPVDPPQYKLYLLDQVLDRTHRPLDAVVLGSSRVESLDPSLLGEPGSSFNVGLPGGPVADAVEAYDHAARQGPPRVVYLGLDAEALVTPPKPSALHRPDHDFDGVADAFPLARRLTSFHETAGSLRALEGAVTDKFLLRSLLHSYAVEPDGRVELHAVAPEARAAEVERYIDDFVAPRFASATGLDVNAFAAAEALLTRLRGDNVTVVLFLTQLHPDAVAAIASSPWPDAVRDEAARRFAGRCDEGVRFVDATDIATWGGQASDFIDTWHVRGDSSDRLAHFLSEVAVVPCVTPTPAPTAAPPAPVAGGLP